MRLWDACQPREMYLSHLVSICQPETEDDERATFFFFLAAFVMHCFA